MIEFVYQVIVGCLYSAAQFVLMNANNPPIDDLWGLVTDLFNLASSN